VRKLLPCTHHVTEVIISSSGQPVTLCDGGLTTAQGEVAVLCSFSVASDQQRPEMNMLV